MNEILLDSDLAKEVLTIILYSENNIQSKIPADFMKKLTSKASKSTLEIHLDKNKSLDKQNLSNDALDTFALIYYLYVAQNEERNEIFSHWVMNDEN